MMLQTLRLNQQVPELPAPLTLHQTLTLHQMQVWTQHRLLEHLESSSQQQAQVLTEYLI